MTPVIPAHAQRDPLTPGPRQVVLVVNGYQDLMEMLRLSLEFGGFAAVTINVDDVRRARADLKGLVETHDPAAVIYDVAPPYDHSWVYLESLRTEGPLRGRPIILTTTNERRLREVVKTSEPIVEIFGKPYDIEQVVAAIHRVLGTPDR
jgi:DNA-binding NtrC family response regulator